MDLIASYHLFITITSFLGLMTAVFAWFRRKRAFSMTMEECSMGMENISMGKDERSMGMEEYSMGKEKRSIGMEERSMGVEEYSIGMENISMGMEELSTAMESITMACNYGDRLQLPSKIELIGQ